MRQDSQDMGLAITVRTASVKEKEKPGDRSKSTDRQDQSAPSAVRSYPAILPSALPDQKDQHSQKSSPGKSPLSAGKASNRRTRRKWTEEETKDLIQGCHIVSLTFSTCVPCLR
jgi:hypothetical protein